MGSVVANQANSNAGARTEPNQSASSKVRAFVALGKPRITFFVVVTTLGGLFLARRAGESFAWASALWAVLGTSLIVASANALNMVIERDIDRRMVRTMNRPLAQRVIEVRSAIAFAVVLGVVAVPMLAFGVNALTCLLAILAHLLYVFAYTPLKQKSHHALLVGAVPGAIPPLLGWTAATGRVDAAGLTLFGILFLWQIPHFLAIAWFRRDDYRNAGLVVMPNVASDEAVKHSMLRYTFGLLAVSLLPVPLHIAKLGYGVMAFGFGAAFLLLVLGGLRRDAGVRWARSVFIASLFYLMALMAGMSLGI
jgi:heme o synthase